jgi:hypothetical protein
MIAVLPILAWGGGAAAAHFLATIGNWIAARRSHHFSPFAMAIAVLAAVIIIQAINQQRQPTGKILRGEGWRGAVRAVQASKIAKGKTVLLSPGLIETERFLASGDAVKISYLAFPLSGPYQVQSIEAIQLNDSPHALAAKIASGGVESAILRTSAANANLWASRIIESATASGSLAFRHFRFGTIQAIQFDRNPLADPSQ